LDDTSEGRAKLGGILEMKMLRIGKGGQRWEVIGGKLFLADLRESYLVNYAYSIRA